MREARTLGNQFGGEFVNTGAIPLLTEPTLVDEIAAFAVFAPRQFANEFVPLCRRLRRIRVQNADAERPLGRTGGKIRKLNDGAFSWLY